MIVWLSLLSPQSDTSSKSTLADKKANNTILSISIVKLNDEKRCSKKDFFS